MFHWSPNYTEEKESSVITVWISLPDLPLNFYHESFLQNITMPIGKIVRHDNCTRCVTRTDGARVCIEMDTAKKPIESIWIGVRHQPGSRLQHVISENLSAYSCHCQVQGHNILKCKWVKQNGGKPTLNDIKDGKCWFRKEKKKKNEETNPVRGIRFTLYD